MAGLLVVQSQHTEKVPWPCDLHLHYEFSLQCPAADQCLIRTHAIVMAHPAKCSQQIRQQGKKTAIGLARFRTNGRLPPPYDPSIGVYLLPGRVQEA